MMTMRWRWVMVWSLAIGLAFGAFAACGGDDDDDDDDDDAADDDTSEPDHATQEDCVTETTRLYSNPGGCIVEQFQPSDIDAACANLFSFASSDCAQTAIDEYIDCIANIGCDDADANEQWATCSGTLDSDLTAC